MPDITREDRQLALRHMRSVVPRVAADRCNRVSGGRDDRHWDVDRLEAFGQEGRAERRRHRKHRAHSRVAIGAAVPGERGPVRCVAVSQGLRLGAQIAKLGRRLA